MRRTASAKSPHDKGLLKSAIGLWSDTADTTLHRRPELSGRARDLLGQAAESWTDGAAQAGSSNRPHRSPAHSDWGSNGSTSPAHPSVRGRQRGASGYPNSKLRSPRAAAVAAARAAAAAEAAERRQQLADRRASSEKAAKLAQKLSQLQPFTPVLPQECMGQLASFGPT